MEKIYLKSLQELKLISDSLPNTRMACIAKLDTLIKLNMSWEKLQLDKNLKSHPFLLTNNFVINAISNINQWSEILFCDGKIVPDINDLPMEKEHQNLFQSLWTEYSKEQYLERIKLYDFRLAVNNLDKEFFEGKDVLDMGCGHGNFAHAILNAGAKSVLGVDFGENSIVYARKMKKELSVPDTKLQFELSTVYKIKEPDNKFDFIIQNGVFHHLDNEEAAYKEMYRLLKPGGSAWIYTEGESSIARDLFHNSVEILKNVPHELVNQHLKHLGFSINKRYHLGDSLKAVYKATSWQKLTSQLESIGFKQFTRLKGGMDYDLDISESDPWSKEKFGEGDIRLLAFR